MSSKIFMSYTGGNLPIKEYHRRIFSLLSLIFVITATSTSLILLSLTYPPYTTTHDLLKSFKSPCMSFNTMVFDNIFNNFYKIVNIFFYRNITISRVKILHCKIFLISLRFSNIKSSSIPVIPVNNDFSKPV